MLKKLLKKLFYVFSHEYKNDRYEYDRYIEKYYDREQIEKYLAQSTGLYDLENRQREIERKGANNRFYI